MLLSEAFDRYRSDVIYFTNQSKSTLEQHEHTGRLLIKCLGDIEVDTLTFEHVRKWKEVLEKTRGVNSVRGNLIKLRCTLKHLQRNKIESLDPELVPLPKRVNTIPNFITKEEVACLIESAGQTHLTINKTRDKAIISLLYASGIRVGELCSLDISQIDNKQFTVVGKGGKVRLCFLDDRTKKLLTDYLTLRIHGYNVYIIARGKVSNRIRNTYPPDNHPALFTSTVTKRRITRSEIEKMITLAVKRCGLERHVTPHSLRHAFATELLKTNTNLRYIQEFLGHASPQTTMMYTHIVNKDLESIYQEHHMV